MIELVLFAVALVVAVLVHRKTQRDLARRLELRQVALDKQTKRIRHAAHRDLVKAAELLKTTQHMQEDARLLHERMDETLSDPNLRRAMRKTNG